jgi:predicted enzyme related to lactoylglutathione lyase
MSSHHDHDPVTGEHINEPVSLDVSDGLLVWRFDGETGPGHFFTEGIPDGGLSAGTPNVTVYVEVEDVAATLAEVERHGGSIIQQPFEIPGYTTVGRFADPEGNQIGIQARRT